MFELPTTSIIQRLPASSKLCDAVVTMSDNVISQSCFEKNFGSGLLTLFLPFICNFFMKKE